MRFTNGSLKVLKDVLIGRSIRSYSYGSLSHAPKDENANRLSHIVNWLECHDDDSAVRTQYLSFLQGLPETFDDERKQAVADTAKWLRTTTMTPPCGRNIDLPARSA